MSKERDYSETEVKFFTPGVANFTCCCIPNDKIYNYIEKLKAGFETEPMCASYRLSFWIRNLSIKTGKLFDQRLYIDINHFNPDALLCGAKNHKQCAHNIKCGKCKDAFMIQNIGKVFFANKYKTKGK